MLTYLQLYVSFQLHAVIVSSCEYKYIPIRRFIGLVGLWLGKSLWLQKLQCWSILWESIGMSCNSDDNTNATVNIICNALGTKLL